MMVAYTSELVSVTEYFENLEHGPHDEARSWQHTVGKHLYTMSMTLAKGRAVPLPRTGMRV